MKKNRPIGYQQNRNGAVPLSQREWNDLNGALDNINVGLNSLTPGSMDGFGIQLPFDAYAFPHIGTIKPGFPTTAIIGADREEDYYPYVDGFSVPQIVTEYVFERKKVGDAFRYTGIKDVYTEFTSVAFGVPNEIAVDPATDPSLGMIVAYHWKLLPVIPVIGDGVYFSGDGLKMYVTVTWSAGAEFENDTQAELVVLDPATDDAWSFSQEWDETSPDSLEDLINAWLLINDPAFHPQSLVTDADMFKRDLYAPVARYDRDLTQTYLERVVQLLFSSGMPGGGGVPTIEEDDDELGIDHPFKSRIYPSDDTQIEVGFLRDDFKDQITIYDLEDGGESQSIDFAAAETVSISSNSYVYYRIYKEETGGWTATLEVGADYVPTDEETGETFFLIGYAEFADGAVTEWRQHAFECPEFHKFKPQRHSFEAVPLLTTDGGTPPTLTPKWRFQQGNFNYNNITISTTDDQVIAQTANSDVYFVVEVDFGDDSFPAFSTPTVQMVDDTLAPTNDLQLGTMGAEQEWDDARTLVLRYKVGEFDSDGKWKQLIMSDVNYMPGVNFNNSITTKYHGENWQLPRMIEGTGQLIEGSNCYTDDNGRFEVRDDDEAADPREFIGLSHDGTDGYFWNSKGETVMENPDDDEDVTLVIRSNGDNASFLRMEDKLEDNYLEIVQEANKSSINSRNDVSSGEPLHIQNLSEGHVKIFDDVDASGTNNQLHISFKPSANKRTAVIESTTDQELSIGGEVAGTDYDKLKLEKMDLYVQGGGNADVLNVLDSTGNERLSTTNTGTTRINDNWNIDPDAPTAGKQAMLSVAGNLDDPQWSSGDTITVVTAVQLDTSNNLQIKTRSIKVMDGGTESSWTTVTGWTTTSCP